MTNEQLRQLCIKHNWFSAGTNDQYDKLFDLNSDGAPAQDLALVIWICTDGWNWLDIVKEIEVEQARFG